MPLGLLGESALAQRQRELLAGQGQATREMGVEKPGAEDLHALHVERREARHEGVHSGAVTA